ncbi:MAG: hypothetical protein PF694_06840 [Bacteroidetes bacterium]|jgi:hypothetical protein|nr:hypothetical protein [Bacteroidota bacterium]
MKKTIFFFIISSIVKGNLLFLTIFLGDYLTGIPILLRFLVYFIIIGIFDWQILKQIKDQLIKKRLIKALTFTYLSLIATLWVTGPLFKIYNYASGIIIEEEIKIPTAGIIIYLIFGLITSLITTIIWIRKNNKTAVNT